MGRYSTYYEIEVSHPSLHKYRHIRGTDKYIVEQKAAALMAQWDAEWDRKARILNRQAVITDGKQEAVDETFDAQQVLASLASILSHSLQTDDRINWDSLKDRTPFGTKMPTGPSEPKTIPKPVRSHTKYAPKLDLWCLFSATRKASRVALAQKLFDDDMEQSRKEAEKAAAQHAHLLDAHTQAVAKWHSDLNAHEANQKAKNQEIDDRMEAFRKGDEGAVLDGIDIALSASKYPSFVSMDYSLDYSAETNSLIAEFNLPNPDSFPTLKEVKYIQSKGEFTHKHITDAEKSKNYDSALYQIALRVISEVFEADEYEHIQRVTFNGWVDYVDRATGMDQRSCILTIGVNRSDFQKIDLGRVDPKDCFRALKGVAASKLIGLAPVAPLQRPSTPDRRFIEGEEVANSIQDTTNLASMDWKDFEHLVRQVFEAEFSSANGEVKVTQASRDGGVDAVIFDPDPIRGGKIVVQAKRYVNTVEVGAVRDLYGTLMNEGATKGILITTSQFGPDARKFAQGKPIVLLDGGHLLHLLEKMGIKARINLQEAKALQKEQLL